MKVPQHQIANSTLRTVASEELQEEIEKELQTARASKKATPSISKLLATSSKPATKTKKQLGSVCETEEEDKEDDI